METLEVRPEITSLIKTVSAEKGINDYTIIDIKTNKKGEGYLGEIFMVRVQDKNSSRQLDMVIKAAFTDEKVRELVPIRRSFQNEIYFYQHVRPLYKKLEKEHGINETIELVPECLKVRTDENEEVLVLENMKAIGFEVFNKKLLLDHDHVELIFKTYGRLHAYSFALRDQKPEEYLKTVEKFYNIFNEMINKGVFGKWLIESSKSAGSCLIPGEDDKVINEFQKYRSSDVVNIFQNIITENCEHSAILHGDCWSNNMLFRYEETENRRKPVDIRLIDWQIIKVGSPVCDLSYSLYSGASKAVFDNLNEYLKIYHDSFSSMLRQLGSDPEQLFPFTALKEHWKKYSKFGMMMAFGLQRTKLTNDEDLVDLRDDFENEEFVEAFTSAKYNEEEYQKRMRGLLWHMYKIDAL